MSTHRDIVEMLPWYVNGTASEAERARVDSHLEACAACREELSVERRIAGSMRAEGAVEFMPAASLKRLQASLDRGEPPTVEAPAPHVLAAAPGTRGTRVAMPLKVAAAVLVAVAAVGVLMLTRSHQAATRGYYTVTTPAPRAREEVVRAVFAPDITLTALEHILAEAHLRIVAGPTEAGVYSLAGDPAVPVSESLRALRSHDVVRFAESTRPSTEPVGVQ